MARRKRKQMGKPSRRPTPGAQGKKTPPIQLAPPQEIPRIDPESAEYDLTVADPPATAAAQSPLTIVGVGASAGGLDACSQLLQALNQKTGMAFVIVQHLAPKH